MISLSCSFVKEVFIQSQNTSSRILENVLAGFEFFNPYSQCDFFPQRLWKVLPSSSYLLYKVVFFLVPSYRDRYVPYLNLLEPFSKIISSKEVPHSLSMEEKKWMISFFKRAQEDFSFLEILRASADPKQYRKILKVQSLFNRVDEKKLQEKLDKIDSFLSGSSNEGFIPLSTQELGIIQFSKERVEFLKTLEELGIEGLSSLRLFWEKAVILQDHPAILCMKKRTIDLLEQGPLGFVLSRQKINEFMLNQREDALSFLSWGSFANYLFTGNPCHVGFLLSNERDSFFSHINSEGFHSIVPMDFTILYPFCLPFRFKITPLIPIDASVDQKKEIELVFSKILKEEAFIKREVQLEGPLAGIQAGLLGRSTPFKDFQEIENIQAREFCTGLTSKTVYQAFLKTLPFLESLGYSKDQIKKPFEKNQHVGRMTILTFLRHFQEKGMLEFIEDPLLKKCIEPCFLKDYIDFWFKWFFRS